MRLRFSILIANMFLVSVLPAQVSVDNELSIQELIEDYLIGPNVQVQNITINGQSAETINNQVGLYTGPSNVIDFNQGIALITGNAKTTVEGGSTAESLTHPIYNDPDLVALSNQYINDAVIVEFDFLATGDSVRFNYVFGSKEYPSYTCTAYNDAFGFFLSGPGIDGPFSNNAKNIALIPGTEIPVAINTVNGGTPTGLSGQAFYCYSANPDWLEHSQYFIHNNPPPADEVKFPGLTQTFTALSKVQCGEWYHIKLAIGDAVDEGYDSGVFLEAGSFTTFGEVYLSVVPQIGGNAIGIPPYDSVLIAGCSEAYIELTRPQGIGAGSVFVEFGGTAIQGDPNNPIPGADYLLGDLDTSFFFTPGVDTLSFTITTLWDGIPNEDEYLTVSLHFLDGCGSENTATATIYFADPYPLDSETYTVVLNCPVDEVLVGAQGVGGIEPYRYDWGDFGVGEGLSEVIVDVMSQDSTYYGVVISDACALEQKRDSVLVIRKMSDPLQAVISPFTDPECPNEPVEMHVSVKDGNGDSEIRWAYSNFVDTVPSITIAGINNLIHFTPNSSNFIHVLPVYLTVKDSCNTTISDTVYVNYPFNEPLEASFNLLDHQCSSEPIDLIAHIKNGSGDFEFSWEISNSKLTAGADLTSEHIRIVPAGGINEFTLSVSDKCGRSGNDYKYTVEDESNANNEARIRDSGLYVYQDSLRVTKLDEIMNIITPNGDNRNDFFAIEGIDQFNDSRMEIYDRWGKVIFSADNYPAGKMTGFKPDGAFDAAGLTDGTYFYVLNVNSGECVQTGTLEVLRGNN